ncbi:MAG: hypothetical protein ISR51_00865 [Rhodospirillales bacterium]|nr:hypothetical protein [Rhodospirillales bacterium]
MPTLDSMEDFPFLNFFASMAANLARVLHKKSRAKKPEHVGNIEFFAFNA